MRYLGNVKTEEEAKTEGLRVSQETGFIVVLEKAKMKTQSRDPSAVNYAPRSGLIRVCWRAWLDRDRPGVGLMDRSEWSPLEASL